MKKIMKNLLTNFQHRDRQLQFDSLEVRRKFLKRKSFEKTHQIAGTILG